MKNLKLLGYLMVFASALLCVQCTSDAIGPPGSDGANGIDGIDGIDGVDGVDGTASCVSCHSNENRDPLFASWELSKHGTGFIGFAAPREDCAQCHGEEGY
ncbi:MAG: NapC/NirT family cytochrome c, partial [Eudoraea sp.]|nr:NapC/NirT family cytochrome c [Eudoraea sp.]